ncbi:MAG: SCP2 sterol-binding domain-containing protein [Thiotrichaceae bacterium]|nr:SCP2 sterol-binding domain-containing protein [Thiotrichaceae bacterium]
MQFTFPVLLATVAETILNHALYLAPQSLEKMAALSGKRIRIEVLDLNLNFTLLPSAHNILVFSSYKGEADVCIQGAPFSLLRLLLQTEANLASMPEITIHGDLGVAQQLQNILQHLDLDWEEQFSKVLGDVPAHGIGSLLRRGHTHLRESIDNLHNNLEDYLQQETQHLPAATEVDHFLTATDHLRDDVARLEQRIQRLTKA